MSHIFAPTRPTPTTPLKSHPHSWWGLPVGSHSLFFCSTRIHVSLPETGIHRPLVCLTSIQAHSHGTADRGTLNDPFADPLAFSSLLHAQLFCSHCAGTVSFIAAVAPHDHPQGQTGSVQSMNPSSDLLAPPLCKCQLGCKQLAHDTLGSHP